MTDKESKDEVEFEEEVDETSDDELTNENVDMGDEPQTEKEVIAQVDMENRHKLLAESTARHSPINKFFHKLKSWFSVKKNRYIAVALALALSIILFMIPSIRFGVLNTFGFRGEIEITVLDEGSSLPLKDVKVMIGDKETATGRDGKAKLGGIKLGPQNLVVEKIAYASHSAEITIKSGFTNLGEVSLDPVGMQFTFEVSDWLSNVVLEGAEVAYGENSVLSNISGEATLTIPPTNEAKLNIIVSADGYIAKTITIDTTTKDIQYVNLVISKPHFYMTKHSGKYDLYKVNADGTDPQLVLAGTGKESSDLHLVNMAESRAIFLASTREGKRNEEGSILYGLFQIDSATDEFEKVDESESIRMHGVSQGRLIYVKVSSGASAQNPERQKLISLDPITGSTRILASSNYFNSIKVTTDVVFYAPSDYYKSEKMPYLFRIDSITGDKTVVHSDEVWTIYRTGYDELTFDAKQDWYQVGTAPGSKPTALSGRPADLVSRLYQDNGVGTKSLLVDDRDGKGYLIIHDIASAQETTLHIQKGLKYPLRWIDDNHIVFRVSDSQEIADYIIDIRGGDPARVVSVSDVPSYDRWYYYY